MEQQMSREYESIMAKARGMSQGIVSQSPAVNNVLAVKSAMSQIVEFLRNELPKMQLNIHSQDATNVSRDILELNRNLQSLQGHFDDADSALGSALPQFGEVVESLKEVVEQFEESARCVEDCIGELQAPVVNVENVKVQNLGEAVSVLQDIFVAITGKEEPETLKISNLNEIQFPKEIKLSKKVMDYLEKLDLLSADADKPIAVRLSDGEKFISELVKSNSQVIKTMGGIMGRESVQSAVEGANKVSSFGDGSRTVTTAGTRVQLSTSSVPCKWVEIVGKVANTGSIWVGGSTVADGSGLPLLGLQSTRIPVSNLNLVYLDSTVNGEGVTYVYGS